MYNAVEGKRNELFPFTQLSIYKGTSPLYPLDTGGILALAGNLTPTVRSVSTVKMHIKF
jgi:hypothetical protein